MAELQRSAMSFRRQGSSGLVWDDKFLGELDKIIQKQEEERGENNQQRERVEPGKDQTKLSVDVGSTSTIERSRSNGGGRAFRTGKVTPAIDPPSPRVSACGCCSVFGKREKSQPQPTSGKRRK